MQSSIRLSRDDSCLTLFHRRSPVIQAHAMLSVSSAPPSTLEFPSSGEASTSQAPPSSFQRPQYLPFRRISLPTGTAPSLIKRHSVTSVKSFESVSEDPHVPTMMPVVLKNVNRKSAAGPMAQNERRRSQWKLKPINEALEAKRRKIIEEFVETERSYVDGLNLIHSHFLEPVIASLDTSHPLLERQELTSIFSNFIDIWNLHSSFFESLSTIMQTSKSSPPPLSPLLLAHFPYLSLYNPFVTAFPTAMASLGRLQTSKPAFATFIAKQEADERCGKLKLRDWLLTVVQRCPRYLLLLKDLIGCTEVDDPEHASLSAVHSLVSKITNSLNTSLHTHAQTLALLALQRNTAQLPFQLISPGRNLVKRGTLLQLEGAADPKEREFLLFTDCIIWLAGADGQDGQLEEKWDWQTREPSSSFLAVRPGITRKRSKSDAELPTLRTTREIAQAGRISEGGEAHSSSVLPKSKSAFPRIKKKKRSATSGAEEKWIYKGRAELVDVEVVPSLHGDLGGERRLEILSPEASFAAYANSGEDRDEWVAAIRTAKASLLISLNAMHPNSTLTASNSNAHIRRTLQALPHLPEDEATGKKPKRGKVEHFVPPIWIPDAKTSSCMRCGRGFGWRRRRHHCRLCGRCVCSGCSGQTFYIFDSASKSSNKPARACDTCYETVFPLIGQDIPGTPGVEHAPPPSQSQASHLTMSGFPSWQSISMPSIAMPGLAGRQASALLGVDLNIAPSPTRHVSEVDSSPIQEGSRTPPRVRIKEPSRPRSYVQILEDFHANEDQISSSPSTSTSLASPPVMRGNSQQSRLSIVSTSDARTSSDPEMDNPNPSLVALSETDFATSEEFVAGSPSASSHIGDNKRVGSPLSSPPVTPKRKEDTVRRHKRFSMPAMALQTTPVTAKAIGEGKKRFSLVLGRDTVARTQRPRRQAPDSPEAHKKSLADGPAATKLNELLGRTKY